MDRIAELAARQPDTGMAWSGLCSIRGLAPLLYGLSLLVVLYLAALDNSWTMPVAVLLVIPLGLLGAVLAASSRELPSDRPGAVDHRAGGGQPGADWPRRPYADRVSCSYKIMSNIFLATAGGQGMFDAATGRPAPEGEQR